VAAAKRRKLRLSWFLVKPSINFDEVDAIVEQPINGTLYAYRVPALHKERDSLFLRASHPSPPRWLSFVEGHVDGGGLPAILGASSSGVLLVPASDQLLAITFGYGRHLVRQEAVVQDFGLKVVLNSIDPAQIKSVDARTFDELTIHTKRGASRDSSLAVFALDNSRDLLRAVTGRSSAGGLGSLSGSSALAVNTDVELPQLPEMAKNLVTAYRAKRYRENFKFIDQMRGEQDPTVIAALDKKLLAALNSPDGDALAAMHLAIPEAVDWQEVAGVRFSFKRKKHEPTPDPKVTLYRELRGVGQITLERLKADKVEAISAVDEDELRGKWRVYDCVVFETDYDKHLYVLSGGDWFRISKAHRDKVEGFVRGLPELKLDLPAADLSKDEDAYNAAAASAIGGVCLDKKLIRLGGVDKVELCDILTKDGTYLHVKKRGRSSTLSHLFAQGVTSAEMLLNDQQFLADAAELVMEADTAFNGVVPTKLGERERIKVGFVVLSRGRRPEKPYGLPFFSSVNLMATAQRLQNAGIEVRVREIKET
jgi:uncharacterized protein (TIGR04141 family)